MSPPLNPPIDKRVISTPTPAQESLLDGRLDRLRAATASLAAPAHLQTSLLSAFKAHHARQRRAAIIAQWFAPGVALAASVGMSAWMVLAPLTVPVPDSGANAAYLAASAETPFVALQSLERIALEPQPRLIETAVPRMWLASYGVPVSPELAGDSLRAEMLVSANGQPLAMRFLP